MITKRIHQVAFTEVVHRQFNSSYNRCPLSCGSYTLQRSIINIKKLCSEQAFTFHKPGIPSFVYTSLKQPITLTFCVPLTCIRTFITSVGLAIALEMAPAITAQQTFTEIVSCAYRLITKSFKE